MSLISSSLTSGDCLLESAKHEKIVFLASVLLPIVSILICSIYYAIITENGYFAFYIAKPTNKPFLIFLLLFNISSISYIIYNKFLAINYLSKAGEILNKKIN